MLLAHFNQRKEVPSILLKIKNSVCLLKTNFKEKGLQTSHGKLLNFPVKIFKIFIFVTSIKSDFFC